MTITIYGYIKDADGRFDIVRVPGDPYINMSNDNALALLRLLGLAKHPKDLWKGKLFPLSELQRAFIRAHAELERRPEKYTRSPKTVYGSPRQEENGTITLRPVRVHHLGIDKEYLIKQLARLEKYLKQLSEKGAEVIGWS